MTVSSVKLQELRAALDDLLLDPNNPRFAKSLDLQEAVPDANVAQKQKAVRALFVNDSPDADLEDEDSGETDEGQIRIGDLVMSMRQIGFVPIDRIVVRALESQTRRKPKYVVIEGNRRVAAAKYLYEEDHSTEAPQKKQQHEELTRTIEHLDVLLLDTSGLSDEQIHDQIGVILGLRHFGSVLPWGTLAKAVNVFHEYMGLPPALDTFVLKSERVTEIAARLSENRSEIISALKTYRAFEQLKNAFPQGPPRPSHYSLVQECIKNTRLATARFIEQNPATFELTAAALENLNTVCEFARRDSMKDNEKILREPKSVKVFSTLVADATSHQDAAVRAFAASLRDEVVQKERTLEDAAANLKSFKIDRKWTEALADLLTKVVEPGATPGASDGKRLELKELSSKGNDQIKLSEARNAFKNVRLILGV